MTQDSAGGSRTRRDVLRGAGALTVGAAALGPLSACGKDRGVPSTTATAAPRESFAEPRTKLSGDLKILLWNHFVPAHDRWFDTFVKDWAAKVGVKVTIDYVDQAQIPTRVADEIRAGQGHDLVQYISTLSQFEPNVLDMKDVTEEANKRWGPQLDLCRKSSLNPTTGKYYAFAPGWVPDPGNYRKSLWAPVGLGKGPYTYDELYKGAVEIKKSKSINAGLGMSSELDSNMAGRALIWAFGGSVQDENENVVLNSDATVAAVEFMTKLFKDTMTNEVFNWNAASNNQGLVDGKLSYILNSISAYRTAQEANAAVADDIEFVPALHGPAAGPLAAAHVMYNWIIPTHAKAPDAAKEFLLHYTANFAAATWASKLYDLCAWPRLTPDVDNWLNTDPFGSKPSEKLKLLGDAGRWSTNMGHPGPASPAVGEILSAFIIPKMYGRAARGEVSAKQAVADAEAQIKPVYDKWRALGLVGG